MYYKMSKNNYPNTYPNPNTCPGTLTVAEWNSTTGITIDAVVYIEGIGEIKISKLFEMIINSLSKEEYNKLMRQLVADRI